MLKPIESKEFNNYSLFNVAQTYLLQGIKVLIILVFLLFITYVYVNVISKYLIPEFISIPKSDVAKKKLFLRFKER